jgi:hypothetical protein
MHTLLSKEATQTFGKSKYHIKKSFLTILALTIVNLKNFEEHVGW